MNTRLKLFWVKLFNFEYWPFWFLYIPGYFYGFWLAIKSGSITYFTTANPGMDLSGAYGMSKSDVNQYIAPEYLPKTEIIARKDYDSCVAMVEKKFQYPFIIKPNIGERGAGVELIKQQQQLINYLSETKDDVLLIQEYITAEVELGVFYIRYPNETTGRVVSIVEKEFLKIIGNGVSTFSALIAQNTRALFQWETLKSKYPDQWDTVLEKGQIFPLEPIGNHCRGTKFLNANKHIQPILGSVFDEISKTIPEFYYGRFDIKVPSYDALYKGEGIKVLELNGVNAEPAHIYEPNYSLIKAYQTIFKHMDIVYEIAKINRKRGFKTVPFLKALRIAQQHIQKQPRENLDNGDKQMVVEMA